VDNIDFARVLSRLMVIWADDYVSKIQPIHEVDSTKIMDEARKRFNIFKDGVTRGSKAIIKSMIDHMLLDGVDHNEINKYIVAEGMKPIPEPPENQSREEPWIGVDLDGTLAHYAGWNGDNVIGKPITMMMARVKGWIGEGRRVKIFSARCSNPTQLAPVQEWLEKYGLGNLEVTNVKDYAMVELWDDRCIQVVENTGRRVGLEDVPGY